MELKLNDAPKCCKRPMEIKGTIPRRALIGPSICVSLTNDDRQKSLTFYEMRLVFQCKKCGKWCVV